MESPEPILPLFAGPLEQCRVETASRTEPPLLPRVVFVRRPLNRLDGPLESVIMGCLIYSKWFALVNHGAL